MSVAELLARLTDTLARPASREMLVQRAAQGLGEELDASAVEVRALIANRDVLVCGWSAGEGVTATRILPAGASSPLLDAVPGPPPGSTPGEPGAGPEGRPAWSSRKLAIVSGRLIGSVRVWSPRPLPPEADSSLGCAVRILAAVLDARLARDEVRELRRLAMDRGRALRTVNARLLEAQDDERARLARELHDDIGQRLAALNIWIGRHRAVPDEDGADIDRIAEGLLETGTAIERIAKGLHPSVLDHIGLGAAVRSLAKQAGTNWGLTVDLENSDGLERIPADVGRCVYRVVQEALRNVSRHSGSSRALVRLEVVRNSLRVQVADAGRGLPANFRSRGMGAIGMEERVKAVHGYVALSSGTGAGTVVSAWIPLEPAKVEGE